MVPLTNGSNTNRPYKLVMHLLSLAVSRGVNLQTHTPVTSVSEARDEGNRWAVSTPRGRLRAKQVVYCTNAYTAGVAPQYRDKIIPVKGICSRIAVPEGAPKPHLPNTYSVRKRKQTPITPFAAASTPLPNRALRLKIAAVKVRPRNIRLPDHPS